MYEYDVISLPSTGVDREVDGIRVVQFNVPHEVDAINHRIETRIILNRAINISDTELSEIIHEAMKEHVSYIKTIFYSEEIKYKDGIQILLFEARVFFHLTQIEENRAESMRNYLKYLTENWDIVKNVRVCEVLENFLASNIGEFTNQEVKIENSEEYYFLAGALDETNTSKFNTRVAMIKRESENAWEGLNVRLFQYNSTDKRYKSTAGIEWSVETQELGEEKLGKIYALTKLTAKEKEEFIKSRTIVNKAEVLERAIKESKERFKGEAKVEDLLNYLVEGVKERAKNQVEESRRRIDDLTNMIRLEVEKYLTNKSVMETVDIEKEIKEKIAKDIELIRQHKNTKEVFVTKTSIIVYTNELYFYEPKRERTYYLGNMQIIMPIRTGSSSSNSDYKIQNLTDMVTACGENCQHPHVFNGGNICWGNLGTQIITFAANKEFYALYISILSFLQTCNIEDEAGKYAGNWRMVDNETKEFLTEEQIREITKDDTIGTRGLINNDDDVDDEGMVECSACGNAVYEDDALFCDDCEHYYCNDCAAYYEGVDRVLCNDCAQEYVRCEECGEIMREEDEVYIEGYGTVCASCADEMDLFTCDHCGVLYSKRDQEGTEIHGSISGDGSDIDYWLVCQHCLERLFSEYIECDECGVLTQPDLVEEAENEYGEITYICDDCREY